MQVWRTPDVAGLPAGARLSSPSLASTYGGQNLTAGARREWLRAYVDARRDPQASPVIRHVDRTQPRVVSGRLLLRKDRTRARALLSMLTFDRLRLPLAARGAAPDEACRVRLVFAEAVRWRECHL